MAYSTSFIAIFYGLQDEDWSDPPSEEQLETTVGKVVAAIAATTAPHEITSTNVLIGEDHDLRGHPVFFVQLNDVRQNGAVPTPTTVDSARADLWLVLDAIETVEAVGLVTKYKLDVT